MTTATAVFTEAFLTRIRPGLREFGFVGTSRVFELPDPDSWKLLGIQKSAGNSAARVRFTLNVLVVGKSSWSEACRESPGYPACPDPSVFYGTWSRPRRIGHLMPDGRDYWWEVTERTEPARLATGVLVAVRDYALPALAA